MNRAEQRYRAANPYRVWGYRPDGTKVMLYLKNRQEASALARQMGKKYRIVPVGSRTVSRVVKRRAAPRQSFIPFGGL